MSNKILQSPLIFGIFSFISFFSFSLSWEDDGCSSFITGSEKFGGYILVFYGFYYLLLLGISLIIWKENKFRTAAPRLLILNILHVGIILSYSLFSCNLADLDLGFFLFFIANFLSIFWLRQFKNKRKFQKTDENILDDLVECKRH